ncbi:MAG: hypothetical protein ACYT04_48145 [Nostoc sp.]
MTAKIEKPKKFPSYSQTAIAFGRLPPPPGFLTNSEKSGALNC